MTSPKVCYICCVYFGDRRCSVSMYDEDRLLYIKEQVKTLSDFHHSLSQIVFVFNLEEEHKELFAKAKDLIPTTIQNTPVEIIERPNVGMSYGAWSDVFSKHQSSFDYYIFNEDDYFINENDFDTYLVNKFNSYDNIGYLAAIVMNPAPDANYPTHAGNSFGISSYKVLNELYQKFGCLPYDTSIVDDIEVRYGNTNRNGQISQTHEIFKLGYNIFDIREDYAVPHDMGPYSKWKWPQYDHFIDHFFHWNDKHLIVPAPLKFGYPCFFLNIIDPQYQRKRTCYIVNYYFGPRRRTIEEYTKDPLCFLKKNIELMSQVSQNLDKIVFNFNLEHDHYKIFNEAIKIIPKKIRNTEVEIFIRPNKGLSYGTFSENFARLRDNFDYFIFNEDDYYLVENNWDEYLIRKYNSLPEAGYLCALQRDEDYWNDNKIHAGHCFGIASTENLNHVWDLYGCLPHNDDTNEYLLQEKAQHEFGYSFIRIGKRVYDIREEYRLAFAQTAPEEDISRWFWWNEKDLIVPAIFAFGKNYSWWECWDDPCIRRTNLEKYEH